MTSFFSIRGQARNANIPSDWYGKLEGNGTEASFEGLGHGARLSVTSDSGWNDVAKMSSAIGIYKVNYINNKPDPGHGAAGPHWGA